MKSTGATGTATSIEKGDEESPRSACGSGLGLGGERGRREGFITMAEGREIDEEERGKREEGERVEKY